MGDPRTLPKHEWLSFLIAYFLPLVLVDIQHPPSDEAQDEADL